MILIEKTPRPMSPVLARIRKLARQIVSRSPHPAFYTDFQKFIEFSRSFLNSNPILRNLYDYVADHLEDDFGHGLDHAVKVAVDAGALMMIEGGCASFSDPFIERRVTVVQSAGLLHDIKRKMKRHAIEGAAYAGKILESYPFARDEIEDICHAIRNHEAFQPVVSINTIEGALVADCLYDADKFRWGPDNFSNTLWDMVAYYNPTLSDFLNQYPKGMEGLEKIKFTFRTRTGQKYGPEIIDIGIAIGDELLSVIQSEIVNSGVV